MTAPGQTRRGGRRGAAAAAAKGPKRRVDYRTLRNPFPPVPLFSEDRIAVMHETALHVLEELGIKVLLPQARAIFKAGGARVDEDSEMVFIGRDIVMAAVGSAPKSFVLKGGGEGRDLTMELGALTIQAGAGAPHATDLVRGRRPGSLRDFSEFTRLVQHFDVLHLQGPAVEPQDIPIHERHYATAHAVLSQSDKVPFVFSRGTPQVTEGFEMIRDFRGLSDADFAAQSWCYTIINTNSPRQIDIPMGQGIIDFARAGQAAVITPFCLMGAMAPVTVVGAVVLSHVEALAAITLSQLSRPGAPVLYGAFASNVDMKSGAPAFGTPEQVKASLACGQLARMLGLPWRNAAGCAANINDAQAAHETQMSAWGAMLSGCTMLIHGAGWIEGGLTVSYEKLITDIDMLQSLAELCLPTPADDAAMALDALKEVQPGGHFFGCAHTMERFETAFYEPVSYDWSNIGTWAENGSLDANTRATAIWQDILDGPPNFTPDADKVDALQAYVAKRIEQGGAPPES